MQLFGDFDNSYRDYGKAKFAILPVPYDKTSTWVKGADKGPDAFLEASFALENYDVETETEAYKAGIATLKPVLEDKTPELLCSAVERETAKLLSDGKFPIMIGGNHTCSIGSIRAMASQYKNLTILQLDAHSDLRPEYEGTELNHACVMYQAQKLCPITQVGIRSQCIEELPYVKKERTFYAHNIFDNNNWQSKAIDTLSENVYITIDLDVFDPSVLPSTGTPEPGGLTYYQVLHFLRSVIKERNVVGFDIVELCPNPTDKASDYLAARLAYQLMTYKLKVES
ncbi:MAG: agmatinase [Paludibacteraceae bacterium]|nr:agmatinase [Paludibacteraceae bacterium]